MKFLIEGTIGKDKLAFKLEVDAKSEKHAKELALIKMGSASHVSKSAISIIKIEGHKKKE